MTSGSVVLIILTGVIICLQVTLVALTVAMYRRMRR